MDPSHQGSFQNSWCQKFWIQLAWERTLASCFSKALQVILPYSQDLKIIAFERIQSCLAGVSGWIGLEKISHHYLKLWMFFSAAWAPLGFLWLWTFIEWIQTSWNSAALDGSIFNGVLLLWSRAQKYSERESAFLLADNTTKSRVSLSQLSFTCISIRRN